MAAEAFLVSFLQVLVDKLAHRDVFKYFGLLKGVDKKLKKWSDNLSAIVELLNDAEERQLTVGSDPLKCWLDDLKDLAFDVEDVLDKYDTKMLKLKIQHAHSSTSSNAWKSILNGVFNFKMNSEIQKITERLQDISERKEKFNMHNDIGTLSTRARQHISPSSSLPDGPVIGRDDDKRKIVELLLKQEHRAANLDVVAIVGMPGVGKTTLAGQVLKDMVATQMFQPAVWVCVSDDFNLEILNIDCCKVLVHTTAKVEFELLESLCLSNISEVMSLETGELFRKGLSKVRDLKINGCEELMFSLKNEGRLLQQLTSLGSLEIEDNSRVVEELGKEADELQILECRIERLWLKKCENLLKVPKWLNQLSSLQELRIHQCSRLVSFPDVGLPPSLKDIEITSCDSLIYLAKFQIPQNLRGIEIRECKSLKSLVNEEALGSSHSCLEFLWIKGCESLTSLSLSGQLLRTLKSVSIEHCDRLELIAEEGFFRDNTNYCLEYFFIWKCENLKSLPDGLCHLSNLQQLHIYECGSLVSIPRLSRGRRPSNMREISIRGCEKLEALPEHMHNLNSLEDLRIDYREGLTFPPNLTSLVIVKVKRCKSLWELEWGLHRLTSLRRLVIYGDDPDTVSFPPDMVRMETLLPKSLTRLEICGFLNLKKLSSKGFQFLTSLQYLNLSNCPKLASIPDEGLPPSLEELIIDGQRREHEDKLPAEKLEKEMKNHSTDGRSPGGKKSKMDKERGFDNSRNILETEPSTSRISISNAGRENIIHEKFHEASNREMENSLGITSQVQYYDISAYKESDDENDDDDNSRSKDDIRPPPPQKAFAASLKNKNIRNLLSSLISSLCSGSTISGTWPLMWKGFQFLTPLQSLQLSRCPKLASIPEEGLPSSLSQLRICGMRVEARGQQREHEYKLPAEKVENEMKSQAIDGRGPGGKKSKDEMANKKMEAERGFDNSRNISETEPSTSRISISNAGRESIVHKEFHEASSNYGYKAEVPSDLDKEMENSIGITSQEQSYDISPYKESDDENDDDDNGKLPENLNSLAKLEIVECEELVVSIANCKQLRQLNIDGCKVLVHTAAKVEFKYLESLCLSNISKVMSLQTGELLKKGLSKVRDLKISGCEEVTSSLKNEEGRLLQRLTCLGRLEIEDNSRLVEELGKEAEELQISECKLEYLKLKKCENLSKLPKGLNQLSSLQELRIHKCSSVVSFPDVGLPPSLKDIRITSCDSLIYFAKFQIPQNLRRIEIRKCKSLKSLVDEEAVGSSWSSSSHGCLEYLIIHGCESLTSLSLSGQLPRTLKHLEIENCDRLELIAGDGFFRDNTNDCLEYIWIWNCQNLKSLPDGLCHLSNLQWLTIYSCGSLVSIPRLSGGRRPSNLSLIIIRDCEKLEALPEDMHNLNSLEDLTINYREGLTFPPNLTSLLIWEVKSCKSLWELEWGLHRLTSLRMLGIRSTDPDTVSFPPDMVRMETLKSLAHLRIEGFLNLKKLSSKGFQFLTSLQSLTLLDCPKLASIPDEGLPPSLTQLEINWCPPVGSKIELSEQDSAVEFEYDFLTLEAKDLENWESGESLRGSLCKQMMIQQALLEREIALTSGTFQALQLNMPAFWSSCANLPAC
ncbi:hypothetical protein DVH24_041924 [Malus domestica]|uniref:Rx N-terminal domain-containing protein n=1 Tax=Malus domestica TaxID=3750 RepID=A0A498IP74_MALDO|nr:hypothetical protein DVH24_041924 [Malus domestica]